MSSETDSESVSEVTFITILVIYIGYHALRKLSGSDDIVVNSQCINLIYSAQETSTTDFNNNKFLNPQASSPTSSLRLITCFFYTQASRPRHQ